MRTQEYYTVLELAELAQRLSVGCLPHTKRGVQDVVNRENWNASPLSRQRTGRGGGIEYHFSIMPEAFVVAMIADEQKEQAIIDSAKAMEQQQKSLVALSQTELNARQRTVMEARVGIVQKVRELEIREGCTSRQAIIKLVEQSGIDPVLGKLATVANARSGSKRTLSKPGVSRWLKVHKDNGVAALAPKASRDTASFPEWFPIFMGYYARPQAPTISEAFEDFRYKFDDPKNAPSYDQVRRCLKKLDRVKGTQTPSQRCQSHH
ncbi:MAG: hypothetical protein COA78_33375 [Blastopirellula sp.]|nr:MAG: hypothetical protein COA78_33375 [Blastopirellula sp.]